MSAAAGAAGAQQQHTKIKKKSSPDRYRGAQWLDVNKMIAYFGLPGKIKNSCWSCLFECHSQKQNVCTQGEKKGGGGAPNQPRSHPLQGRCCKVSSPNMDSNEKKKNSLGTEHVFLLVFSLVISRGRQMPKQQCRPFIFSCDLVC